MDFKGLLITLNKRKHSLYENDNCEYTYGTFGYYDGMKIDCIENWYDFRPQIVTKHNGNISIEDNFVDKHTIKVFFPSKATIDILEKRGFNYQFWGNAEAITDDPYIVLSQIHLADGCIKIFNNRRNIMESVIKEISLKIKNKIADLHCAIFPSIGYCDLIMLCRCNDIVAINRLIDNFRNMKIEKQIMVSDIYTISGIHVGAEDKISFSNEDEIKLSLNFQLQAGVTAYDFKNAWNSKISDLSKKYDFLKELTQIEFYYSSGDKDCALLSQMPISAYAKLYFSKEKDVEEFKILNPGNGFFNTFITNVYTSISAPVQNETGKIVVNNKNNIDVYKNKFLEFSKEFEVYAIENNIPIRGLRALQKIMKVFLEMLSLGHTFDLEHTIGKAFDVFINNVKYAMANYPNYTQYLSQAMDLFQVYIGNLVGDLFHSDGSFIEGQTFTHPSTGSATKLLLSYSNLLNETMHELLKLNSQEEDRVAFIAVSGGCDATVTYNVFSYFNQEDLYKKTLAIVQIPEMSLFDIKGNLFRLLHECMHMGGNREREKRSDSIIKIVATYYASNFADIVFDYELIFGKGVEDISNIYPSSFIEEEKKIFKSIVDIEKNRFVKEFSQKVSENLTMITKDNSGNYYGQETENSIIMGINLLFNTLSENEFIDDLYYSYMEKHIIILNKIISEFNMKTGGSVYTKFNSELIYQKKMLNQKNRKDKKAQEFINIYAYCVKYAKNDLANDELYGTFSENAIDATDIIGAQELVQTMMAVMRECHADCCSLKILDISMADFIFSFIYECNDIDHAFPDFVSAIRLGIDLEVIYGITERLNLEQQNSIRSTWEYWSEQGYQYKSTAEQIIQKIDEILQTYSQWYDLMSPAVDYVKKCVKTIKKGRFKFLQELCNYSTMTESSKIYLILNILYKKWSKIDGVINDD